MLQVTCIVGARPNFVKIAPIMDAIRQRSEQVSARLVHTGQHYTESMSESFFQDLGIPEPDVNLSCGSGSHAEQTARIMVEFEKEIVAHRPDAVLVVGDVNSTLACGLVAKKLWVPLIHVEAGLRSKDMRMPEEVNRKCTDAITDHFFTYSADADANLLREGIPAHRIHFAGNVMIDSLLKLLEKSRTLLAHEKFGVKRGEYAVVTLHRPSNVDVPETLKGIIGELLELSKQVPVIWPIHPRTTGRLKEFGLWDTLAGSQGMHFTDPVGYLEMLSLSQNAKMIVTDSGGLQEEATVLQVPCITLRETTERPITVWAGANIVVGSAPIRIRAAIESVLTGTSQSIVIPPFWDGCAAGRIVDKLIELHASGVLWQNDDGDPLVQA